MMFAIAWLFIKYGSVRIRFSVWLVSCYAHVFVRE